jgi:hypothetical protein
MGFKKKDFEEKLGGILVPELKDYYKQQGFAYLEDKIASQ